MKNKLFYITIAAISLTILLSIYQNINIANAEQLKCPVMGGNINKDIFTVYNNKKIYFCCSGCIDSFNKNPKKYLKKMKLLCTGCNELKKSKKCITVCSSKTQCCPFTKFLSKCKNFFTKKPKQNNSKNLCDGCGKIKGSPKCCK